MFHLATFDEIAGIAHGIETTNPAMVDRIRRAADRLNRYEIAARLAQAIAEAADAAHVRAFEQAQFGEASADAIAVSEYYNDLAAPSSLVADEHQRISSESRFANYRSVHSPDLPHKTGCRPWLHHPPPNPHYRNPTTHSTLNPPN